MKEIWKDIKNYEGYYQVSNTGKIRSLDRYIISKLKNTDKVKIKGKTLKLVIRGSYYSIQLFKNGKYNQRPIHRIVAETFIANVQNKPQINHIDGNKLNNYIDNLEWCTQSENMKHAYDIGLKTKRYGKYNDKSKKVYQYDLSGNFIKKWYSTMDVERELGIKHYRVSGCYTNPKRNKTAGGYIWKK